MKYDGLVVDRFILRVAENIDNRRLRQV